MRLIFLFCFLFISSFLYCQNTALLIESGIGPIRHVTRTTYQLKGYLNQNSKTIIIKVSAKYKRVASYTNLMDPVQYKSWVNIPRVKGDWKLIVENNL